MTYTNMPICHILDISSAYVYHISPYVQMCRYQHTTGCLLIPMVRYFELDLPPTHPGGCVPHHQAPNLLAHISCVGLMQP